LRIRYDRLIAECLKISRSEAKRVLENGVLSVEVVPWRSETCKFNEG